MGSIEVLGNSIQRTHDDLAERLQVLRMQFGPPGDPGGQPAPSSGIDGPHRGYVPIDRFVTAASRHMHAVNDVLVPPARHEVPGGKAVTQAYLDAAHELEVVLVHVKAHEFGSVYETRFSWPEVWAEVGAALAEHRDREEQLAERLTDCLDDEELGTLAVQLREAEPTEPSRPHPYLPHTGLLGGIARRLVKGTDRFWDHAEGRMVPLPARAKRKRPGLIGQYLLANPRMDDRVLEPADELPDELPREVPEEREPS